MGTNETFWISIRVEDIVAPKPGLADSVQRAAEAHGADELAIETDADGTALTACFAIKASDEGEARPRAEAVLDVVRADEFVWQVGVSSRFVP